MIELTALDLLEEKGVTELPSAVKALQEAETLRIPSDSDQEEFLVFREKITDFHARLVMEARNARLSHYYQTLYFSLARYQYLHIKLNVPQGYERPTGTHHQILALVGARQYTEAKSVLLDHLENAYRTQEAALQRHLESVSAHDPAR